MFILSRAADQIIVIGKSLYYSVKNTNTNCLSIVTRHFKRYFKGQLPAKLPGDIHPSGVKTPRVGSGDPTRSDLKGGRAPLAKDIIVHIFNEIMDGFQKNIDINQLRAVIDLLTQYCDEPIELHIHFSQDKSKRHEQFNVLKYLKDETKIIFPADIQNSIRVR